MTREDVAIIQERRMSQQSQGINFFNVVNVIHIYVYIYTGCSKMMGRKFVEWIGDAKISGKCQETKVLNPTVFESEALKEYRPIETEAELRLRIMEAAETICNIPGVFERTRQSFLRRCQSCIYVRGRNFEHLF